jgi:hypothetical protein
MLYALMEDVLDEPTLSVCLSSDIRPTLSGTCVIDYTDEK